MKPPPKRKNQEKHKAISYQVADYIFSNNLETLKEKNLPQQLADSLNISKTRLSHQFKKEMNITLGHYLINQRMFQAGILLIIKENDFVPLKEISKRVGFKSYSHFLYTFKKFYSISPSNFRMLSSKANNRWQ